MKHVLIALLLLLLVPLALPAQQEALAAKSSRAAELMQAGSFKDAAALYRQLVRALPDNAGLQANLGIALHMARQENEAIVELRKAIKLDAGNVPAQMYLGLAYLSVGDAAKAIAPLRAAVRWEPDDPDARQSLGEALQAQGYLREAAEQFAQAAAIDPRRPSAWYQLGRSYELLSQRAFDDLFRAGHESAYWLALTADTVSRSLKFNSAFFLYRAALEKAPNLRGVHAGIAEVYEKSGHADWAATEAEREKQVPPPDCAVDRLECAFRDGRYAQIVQAGGTTPDVFYWKTRAYSRLALEAFSHLEAFPESAEFHELKAETEANRRNDTGAAEEWKQAYELSDHDPRIGGELALALIKIQDNEGARVLLERLIERQPANSGFQYLMGGIYVSTQQPEKGIPYLLKALSLDPGMIAAHEVLGKAYFTVGQFAKAIPHLKAALDIDHDGSLHYQLARAYQSTEQAALAAPLLKQYQEIHQRKQAETEQDEQRFQITPP